MAQACSSTLPREAVGDTSAGPCHGTPVPQPSPGYHRHRRRTSKWKLCHIDAKVFLNTVRSVHPITKYSIRLEPSTNKRTEEESRCGTSTQQPILWASGLCGPMMPASHVSISESQLLDSPSRSLLMTWEGSRGRPKSWGPWFHVGDPDRDPGSQH